MELVQLLLDEKTWRGFFPNAASSSSVQDGNGVEALLSRHEKLGDEGLEQFRHYLDASRDFVPPFPEHQARNFGWCIVSGESLRSCVEIHASTTALSIALASCLFVMGSFRQRFSMDAHSSKLMGIHTSIPSMRHYKKINSAPSATCIRRTL